MDPQPYTDKLIYEMDSSTEKFLQVYLYTNVQNISEIHKKLVSKELDCCILKPALVCDPFQLVIAANRAALNERYNQMVTRSLPTEIILCLAATGNIAQSLKTFGIGEEATTILVLTLDRKENMDALERAVEANIRGERIAPSRLHEFSDPELIARTYKISDIELTISRLAHSVITRINEKEYKAANSSDSAKD